MDAVSLATQQKQYECQETLSESNFISFHLPNNQLLEKLTYFAAACEQISTNSHHKTKEWTQAALRDGTIMMTQ